MKASLRARRMARNHEKLAQKPRLNLVALMDIFTILVFFLMVNNGDVEVLQADSKVPLPESISERKPESALTIKISEEGISVDGKTVESVAGAMSQGHGAIDSLAEELQSRSPQGDAAKASGLPVVIMGHQHMPYELLKRVLATCAAVDYREIALAVNSTGATGEEPTAQVAGL